MDMTGHVLKLPADGRRSGEGGLRTRGQTRASVDGQPLVTIVTVVLNKARSIGQTMASVRKQGYANIEYIVIDGGSNDGTVELIRTHEEAIDYWVSEPDSGIYDAWNKGVRLANGEWIAFLGAGDTYAPDAVQAYVDFILSQDRGESLHYVSSRVSLVADGIVKRVIGKPWHWTGFRKYMTVAHVGSFHRKSLYEQYGLYDTAYRICGDYELLLRPRDGLRAAFLDRVTAAMDLEGVSNQDPRSFGETMRAKISTGGRARLACRIEKWEAIVKWKVRKWTGR